MLRACPQAPNLRRQQLREVAVECQAELSTSGDLFVQTWTLHTVLGLKRTHARQFGQERKEERIAFYAPFYTPIDARERVF